MSTLSMVLIAIALLYAAVVWAFLYLFPTGMEIEDEIADLITNQFLGDTNDNI